MHDAQAERVLQFGTGKFLRAFADLFLHELNEAGANRAQVVAAQSTGSGRAAQFNARQGRYHVAVRGLWEGRQIDQVSEVRSVSRALAVHGDWREMLAAARSESLAAIVSNTTEAGYALHPDDSPGEAPPRSFPARLLAVLEARFEAGLRGVTILPCELVERNGDRLRQLVLEQAAREKPAPGLVDWLQGACVWRNTLVDRIVAAPRPGDPMAARDPLFCVAEPFALWLIEGPVVVPVFEGHAAVQRVENLEPYHLRKVRILNGAHTALVAKAMPLGLETVREAISEASIARWLEQLLFEEIVPTLEGRTDRPGQFARQCLERFANPFLDHRLADIALAHDAKLGTRLLPTYQESRARFGRAPKLLGEILRDRV